MYFTNELFVILLASFGLHDYLLLPQSVTKFLKNIKCEISLISIVHRLPIWNNMNAFTSAISSAYTLRTHDL